MRGMRGYKGPLHAGTADLHHWIEHRTDVGRRMAAGTPCRQLYAGWLSMKLHFARMVHRHVPPACQRADALAGALIEMGADVLPLVAAREHAEWLARGAEWERERRMTGTMYVVVGSMFGAEQIARLLAGTGLPVACLRQNDAATEVAFLRQLRQRGDCLPEAMMTFEAMIACCDEIERHVRSAAVEGEP